jgi:hypothetical protein
MPYRKVCPNCNKFYPTAHKNQKYCSRSCYDKASIGRTPHNKYTHDDFLRKIKVTDTGCWEWTGYIDKGTGYGKFGDHSWAHRYSYQYYVGEIPLDFEIDHVCRNRLCVNPSPQHLEAVTSRVNKLRSENSAFVAHRTGVCKKGHPFTPETTYTNPATGWKHCKICANDLRRKRQGVGQPKPPKAPRLFCSHGHYMSEENTRAATRNENGKVYTYLRCRACCRESNKRRRDGRKASKIIGRGGSWKVV